MEHVRTPESKRRQGEVCEALGRQAQAIAQTRSPTAPVLPFRSGEEWWGSYACGGEPTNLVLRIEAVDGPLVRALFEFEQPGKARGSFRVLGEISQTTGEVTFHPTAWVLRPPGFVTAGLRGRPAEGGRKLVGSVVSAFGGCGDFEATRIDR